MNGKVFRFGSTFFESVQFSGNSELKAKFIKQFQTSNRINMQNALFQRNKSNCRCNWRLLKFQLESVY